MVTHTKNPKPNKREIQKGRRKRGISYIAAPHCSIQHDPLECYCMNDNHVSLMRDPLAANPSCASSAGGARAVTA
jgi:hypothetical protein